MLLYLVHALQRLAGTAHHTGQRIVGDHHRQAGLFHQQTVQIAQLMHRRRSVPCPCWRCPRPVRRCLLQRGLHRTWTMLFSGSVSASRISLLEMVKAARHAFREVTTVHFHLAHFACRGRRNTICFLICSASGLADQHAVVATDVVDDGFVELVAADAHPNRNTPHRPARSRPLRWCRRQCPTTMEPVASSTGRSAPIAAAIGSSINSTRRAPAP